MKKTSLGCVVMAAGNARRFGANKLAAEVGVPEGFKDAPRGPRGPRGDRGPAMDCPRGDGPRGDAGYYDGPHRGHY